MSSIMDLYNGEIIAYTIGDKQDTAFVLYTLDQLPKQRIVYCIVIGALFILLLITRTK
ncbi:TPA: hypothetical protein I0F65_RS14395 [Enterococcus faecalis]|nr:hypothetical protein [Enterococcus faecalis]HBI1697939.1 hypothetical protein [Enterococcus faecalis]HBI1700860.1 hypothetical protein [Enterococcus faecalis]HBI1706906.1 hypothetical protein [Enterococcus faecalis]HBI1712774.1 hypothetical protein [Enterococcus faecalis]